jgi:anti-sigma28 factor (negative regulator of flagellin synthesis)
MRIDRTNVGHVMEPKTKSSLQPIPGDKVDNREVVVSPELQQKLDSVSQQEATKAERLNALRNKIDSGEYKVDFDQLAAKILDEDLFTK